MSTLAPTVAVRNVQVFGFKSSCVGKVVAGSDVTTPPNVHPAGQFAAVGVATNSDTAAQFPPPAMVPVQVGWFIAIGYLA